ncbi:hypothetical protein COCON_G00032930 [Conger conger]|uniref:Granulins domain-containing protein n=1 Tax=Conger conger TaxID=82655 RepID=A0A9Q1I7F5_CONCO|nr:hypothetical protein COCON_G00032930 [Conger conger]
MMLKAGVLCTLLALTSALTCPDASVCKDGSTCCQTPSNKYGCCPLPNTVRSFSMIHAVPVNLDFDNICPDKTRCPGEFSCLKTRNGKYSCCPLPQGVSCFDGRHCCPNEYQCSKDGISCTRSAERVEAVICPDQVSECPDETTCCQLPDSSWGCCPLPKAVCCADREHCCPMDTICDLEHSKCVPPSGKPVPMWEKFPARRREAWEDRADAVNTTAVTCPDGKSRCPDHSTCCTQTGGSYGCCPFPDALCCSDRLHCCPAGTRCDLEHGTCRQEERPPAPPRDGYSVECLDHVTTCPDETTCCMLNNGSYGCCPMLQAVCCVDHLHCCPEDTTCDLVHSMCVGASGNITWATKIPGVPLPPVESTGTDVRCDESVSCPDGCTCCKIASGQWACCPLPKAVCCEDHEHCCPQGTVCNLAAETCDDPLGSTAWLEKVPAFSWTSGQTMKQECDPTTTCAGKATCCKDASGKWACCPLPKAVCCEDHIHCCPENTVCNLAAQTCDDPSGSTPWLEKVPAVSEMPDGRTDAQSPAEVKNITCDPSYACPIGSTCCKTEEGIWACCPLPKAVCCDDHEHCCPGGYKCDVVQQTCVRPGGASLPWASKQPALMAEQTQGPAPSSPPHSQQCDSQTTCPRDTTCCYMDKMRKWGCCPLPNAVCCADGDHCCPEGYECHVARTSCQRGSVVIPWYRKEEALGGPAAPTDVKCDAEKSCAAGTTCCLLPSGDWGCCPLVKAVCCSDHLHCCPQGYTCNMTSGTCERKGGRVFQSDFCHHLGLLPLSQGRVL